MKKQKIAIANPHMVKIKGGECLAFNIVYDVCKKPIIKTNHTYHVESEVQEKNIKKY